MNSWLNCINFKVNVDSGNVVLLCESNQMLCEMKHCVENILGYLCPLDILDMFLGLNCTFSNLKM